MYARAVIPFWKCTVPNGSLTITAKLITPLPLWLGAGGWGRGWHITVQYGAVILTLVLQKLNHSCSPGKHCPGHKTFFLWIVNMGEKKTSQFDAHYRLRKHSRKSAKRPPKKIVFFNAWG
jgi:hypothetical protein